MYAGALLLAALALATAPAAPARGQGVLEHLNIDRLRLEAVGGGFGTTKPARMIGTRLYELHADYGEISPHWRVIFTATYWGSRYTDAVVREFLDTLRSVITDPSGDDTIRAGPITVSDVEVGGDLRWSPAAAHAALQPWLGGGLAGHVVNAEGRLIKGTFVEHALDNIAVGVGAGAGLDLAIASHLIVGLQARYDLLSGGRFGSLRATGTWRFDTSPNDAPAPGSGQ